MKSGATPFIILLSMLAILIGGVRYYLIPSYYPQLLKLEVATQDATVTVDAAFASPSPSPVPAGSIATVSAQLLKTLTPRQKVAQLIAAPITVPVSDKEQTIASSAGSIQNEVPGFITLFGQNVSALQADRLTRELKKIPIQPRMIATQPTLTEQERQFLNPLIAVDHEGGSVQRLNGEGMTVLPSATEQCKLQREELRSLLERAAKELRGVGIDIVFAPVMDLGANHPILRTRLCSDSAEILRLYGTFWIDAMQAQHVISVLKHFPGIGQTTVDLHKKSEVISIDPTENSVFLGLLTTYPSIGVMTTHVSLKTDDGSAPLPCTIFEKCIENLRDGSPRLIFTDGLEMVSASGPAISSSASSGAQVALKQSLSNIAILAVEAGHNVILLGKTVQQSETDQIVTDLADRYQRNPVFKQKVDQALRTIWQTKYEHWLALGTLISIQ